MSRILASNVLANGLRTEFADTYGVIRNRQADSRLGDVMDLGIGATNRQHEFAYFKAAPHMTYWPRGDSIPTDAMDSVQFTVPIYEWARRVPWSKFDREDDQTQSLFDMARMAGESAALLPERFFFDLIQGSTSTLPAVPLAPDGVAFFNNATRFGAANGNSLTGGGVTTTAQILTDYYTVLEQFMAFQDGKGQPLLSPETIAAGTIIIHPSGLTEIFEEAFLMRRQIGTGGSTPSNIVQDASRTVSLWGTPRLTDVNDWFVFLKAAPKQAAFMLNRKGVQEFSSLEGDNNGDHTRNTGEEYVQWEERSGAGIALPYAAIEVTNT